MSFWKNVWSGTKKGAWAIGRGAGFVYRKGSENTHYLLPVLNGVIGDKLAESGDFRAIQMSFRLNGEDIAITDPRFKSIVARNARVLIFVHGLMVDEVLWQEHAPDKPGFAPRLAEASGGTALYVRYNSGMHVSENGRALSNLIQAFVDEFSPEQIAIVAHSMGGLVSRSAGYYAGIQNQNWTQRLRRVVLLGVPNDGSYLEKLGHLTTTILKTIWTIPTRIIGNIANQRSNGIKDLRWGFLVDEDWKHAGAEGILSAKRTNVAPIPDVTYYVVVGTLTKDDQSPVNLYFGDGLVGRKSASGEVFRQAQAAHGNSAEQDFLVFRVFPGLGHVGLITNEEVYDYVRSVLVVEK
ncbi:MAG: alpha/beta fold hydrolase [Spirochaetia bacterium]|nr:alpha/beta fold hydrolase [Spirochaetia bacterium]